MPMGYDAINCQQNHSKHKYVRIFLKYLFAHCPVTNQLNTVEPLFKGSLGRRQTVA